MSFMNDYALYPDDMESATEGFIDGVKDIFSKVWEAIKKFGGWLKDRLNDIKEWGIKLKQKIADKVSDVAGNQRALQLIAKIKQNTEDIALTLKSGLNIIGMADSDENKISEAYSMFASKQELAAAVIKDCSQLPNLPFMTYDIAKMAHATLYKISNENSDMAKIASDMKDLQKDATKERSKILEKFINLHSKLQACTAALFKRCASYKLPNKEENVYKTEMKNLKERNKDKGKDAKEKLYDVDAGKMGKAEADKLKNMASDSKANVWNEISKQYKKYKKTIENNGNESEEKFTAEVEEIARTEVENSKQYAELVSATGGHGSHYQTGFYRMVRGAIDKAARQHVKDLVKANKDQKKNSAKESAIDNIVTDFIYQQAYENAYNDLESRADAAFEAAYDDFESSFDSDDNDSVFDD